MEAGEIEDEAHRILAVVKDSKDSAAIRLAYKNARDLLIAAACERPGSVLADRLALDAKALASREQRALRDLALTSGNTIAADNYHEIAQRMRRETIDFAKDKVAAGRSLADLNYEDPALVEAYADDDEACYLVKRDESDPPALHLNANHIEAKARRAIERYESLGETRSATSAYVALLGLYNAIGDIERDTETGLKLADLWEHLAQGAEGGEQSDYLLSTYRVRCTMYLQRLMYDALNVRFDRYEEVLARLLPSLDDWMTQVTLRGDLDELSEVKTQVRFAQLVRVLNECATHLFRWELQAAREKLADALSIIEPLDRASDPQLIAGARLSMMSLEVEQHRLTALIEGSRGDWDAADYSTERALQMVTQLKALAAPDVLPVLAARETAIRTSQKLFEGQRLASRYQFGEALQCFSELPRIEDSHLSQYRAELANHDQPLVSLTVLFIDINLALAKAKHCSTEAALSAYLGKREAAIALQNSAVMLFHETRALAAHAPPAMQQIYDHFSRLERDAVAFRQFLESTRPDHIRIRLEMVARSELRVDEPLDIVIKLRCAADAPVATTCAITTPLDCAIVRAFGLVQDQSQLTWSGVMGPRETQEFLVTVQPPSRPGLYYFQGRCESLGGFDEASIKVKVVRELVRVNLGIMRVNFSEPARHWLKILGWVSTLLLGGVVGALAGKFFHQ